MGPGTPRQLRAEKAAKAKRLLSGAPLRKDDLADEDQEWEWVYEKSGKENNEDSSASEDNDDDATTPKKRRRRTASKAQGGKIVGARKGSYKVKIGDAVLLENENSGTPWVGIICYFCLDTDGDMAANFLCEFPVDLYHVRGLIECRVCQRERDWHYP